LSFVVAGSRWGRLPQPPNKLSGLGRGSLYGLAKVHHGLLRKFGSATLVDLQMLDEILADLPAAEIGTDHNKETVT
jgi:hypothetical protein